MTTQTTDAQIVATYSQGRSVRKTARAHGVSMECVKAALAAAGVKIRRGFACMPLEKRRSIAAMGGAALEPHRRSFSQSHDLAVSAGRKGGLAMHHGPDAGIPR